MSNEDYDFVIIGAGCAGLAAAMYGARLGLRTLCLGASNGSEIPIGGVITTTNIVENYPGFVKISGDGLAEALKKHALAYDLVKLKEERASKVRKSGKIFEIVTEQGTYSGKTVLFATGTRLRKLDIVGSTEFENKGVAYCALCDAPLFKGKTVAVIGGSDTAVKDALVLAEHAKKVYIIYRGKKIRAEPANLGLVNSNKKIEIITESNLTKITGKKFVESVELDREYNGSRSLKLDGVFVAIGHEPISELAKELGVKLNNKKEIILDHKTSETNISGVFAAGDVSDKNFKQAITGVSEGCTAAYSAYEYITKNSLESKG